MQTTANAIITQAMIEAGWLAPGESGRPEEVQYCLNLANDEVDLWSAAKKFAYNVNFETFTLQANHQPHTLGPTGDFVYAQRPVKIENAALILQSGSVPVDLPIMVRDDDWWAAQTVKTLATNVPTDLYYSPDVPNGSCYFWPISTVVQQVRLELWEAIGQFATLTTKYDLPQGYKRALELALAAQLDGPNQAAIAGRLQRAMSLIEGNNMKSPRISIEDSGMGRDKRPTFNYYAGKG